MFSSVIARNIARMAPAKRAFSGPGASATREELIKEGNKWLQVSYAGVAFCIAFSVYNFVVLEHDIPSPVQWPYMKWRIVPFPWKCQDCEFFNNKCFDECRAKAAGEQA